jgi:ankyrin repeat protein
LLGWLARRGSWACARGHYRLCERLLIDHRIRPDRFERAGSATSPLHLAVLSGSTQAVEVMLRAGFDIHWRYAHGATPINLAAQHGKLEVFEVHRH